MHEMKYIIFNNCGLPIAVIFSDQISHSEMASKFDYLKPKSAGMISVTSTGEVLTYGRSTTLNLVWQLGDDEIIERMLGRND